MTYELIILLIYAILLILGSFISLYLYKKDKNIAKSGGERLKEKTLLESSALFGAFGSFIGRIIFHHKTDKKYFSIVIYISLLLQILVLALLIYLGVRSV